MMMFQDLAMIKKDINLSNGLGQFQDGVAKLLPVFHLYLLIHI